MTFRIIRGDITKIRADAVVNTANPEPTVGAGTDTAIYNAAGREKLLAARREIGPIPRGAAAATPAFALPAKYIIHTVGPVWVDGRHGEREILRSCYESSLALAEELGCESAAFPLIAAGSYGFPKDEALSAALSEIGKFLLSHDMEVTLAVFDRGAFELSGTMFSGIREFIDQNMVERMEAAEYAGPRRIRENRALAGTALFPPEKDLESALRSGEDTFQQRLLRLIDQRGLDDVTVYKRANVDRKVFSKLRCNPDYRPSKGTALSFAMALRLDMPETEDLLARAGMALSPSSKFDLIVAYFITNKNYNIFELNAALFKYCDTCL